MKLSEKNNHTVVTEFFLLGFHIDQDLRMLFFSLLLCVNCCTICGNFLIVILVSISRTLHTPMYFFISQLSIMDILLTTDIAPFMLHILLKNGAAINFVDCMIQLYFFCALEIFECFLLTVMSYDRYVAICNPLRYSSIMNSEYCVKLVVICWAAVFFIVIIDTSTIFMLNFCGANIIDHFFCDLVPLLKIACSGTQFLELDISVVGPPMLLIPITIIVVTYVNIISTILRIPSNISRQKAFSTCSSHLIVVSIFYWTIFSVYIVPTKGKSSTINKALSLLYTVFTPFINPIIYSLRNKDIMKAAQETFFHFEIKKKSKEGQQSRSKK